MGDRPIVLGALIGSVLAFLPSGQVTLPLHACSPQGVAARCGMLPAPENRARPAGRAIGLNVVVIPARLRPARPDVHERRDIVLVDQRGTGSATGLDTSCARAIRAPAFVVGTSR